MMSTHDRGYLPGPANADTKFSDVAFAIKQIMYANATYLNVW